MTREERQEHAKRIARNILMLGGVNFVGLSNEDLLVIVRNILEDYSESIISTATKH